MTITPSLAETIWDIAVVVALPFTFLYGWKVVKLFKGGRMGLSLLASMVALAIIWCAFIIKVGFDIVGVEPLDVYSISIRDLGVLASIMLLLASYRTMSNVFGTRQGEPRVHQQPLCSTPNEP